MRFFIIFIAFNQLFLKIQETASILDINYSTFYWAFIIVDPNPSLGIHGISLDLTSYSSKSKRRQGLFYILLTIPCLSLPSPTSSINNSHIPPKNHLFFHILYHFHPLPFSNSSTIITSSIQSLFTFPLLYHLSIPIYSSPFHSLYWFFIIFATVQILVLPSVHSGTTLYLRV